MKTKRRLTATALALLLAFQGMGAVGVYAEAGTGSAAGSIRETSEAGSAAYSEDASEAESNSGAAINDDASAGQNTDKDAAGSEDEASESADGSEANAGDEAGLTGSESGEISAGLPSDAFDGLNIKDEDELLESYVKSKAAASTRRLLRMERSSRGWNLSGNNLIYYNHVKELATEVAAGNQSETYTSFAGTELISKTTYSASDLGLSAIASVSNGELVMTSEAKEKLNDLFRPESWSDVMTAALLDMPYELYWYNRYNTSKCLYRLYWHVDYTTTSVTISTDPSETYAQILLPLIEDYGISDGSSYKIYMADTDKTGAASAAAGTARSIVSKYASSSDYNKLKGYLDEVCALTEYDEDAADDVDDSSYEPYQIYNSPWQLISVFDGDTSTKVVCAGYAKAFKFLCDLSSFDSNWIECQTIYGTVQNRTRGSSAASHLWCTVRMNDGRNYIVDPTWYDGSSGYYIFLKGGTSGSDYCDVSASMKRNSSVSHAIRYTYSDRMADLFSEDELAIASSDYDPSAEEENNEPISIESARVSEIEDRTYTGKALTGQHPLVQVDGRTLTEGVDYTVGAYSNNKNVGKASFAITGIGQYSGSLTKTFKINPKGVKLSKVTKGKKCFTAKWKKLTTKMSKARITGYQIQYSTSSSFASGNKTVTVKGYKKVSRKVKKLKARTTYYVRIRTYLKAGGVTYYSAWSPYKKVKTK